MIRIIWDYISPRGEHWLEWEENGKTTLMRVDEDKYESLTTVDDFLN